MAQDNIVDLVTDIYDYDTVDSLFSNLGVEAFSGQSISTRDMTATGWLISIATNAFYKINNSDISDDDKKEEKKKIIKSLAKNIFNKHEDIQLIDEVTNSNDNILHQTFAYANLKDNISVKDILGVIELTYEAYSNKDNDYEVEDVDDPKKQSEVLDKLKAINDRDISPAMIWSYTYAFVKDTISEDDDLTKGYLYRYRTSMFDISYDKNISAAFPIARLIKKYVNTSDDNTTTKDNIKKAIKTILKDKNFDDVFHAYRKDFEEPNNNSYVQCVNELSIENTNKMISNFLKKSDDEDDYRKDISAIKDSIDLDNCSGIRLGETGFDLNVYAQKIENVTPEPVIDINYFYFNKVGENVEDIPNHSLFYFPYQSNHTLAAYSSLGLLAQGVFLSDDNTTWDNQDFIDKIKEYLKVPNDIVEDEYGNEDNSDLKRFFYLNALLGNCRDFSGGDTSNLFGPLNIILNKINKAHKSWCNANDKTFNDYKSKYEDLVEKINMKNATWLGYKHWCSEYQKDF